MKRLLLLLLVLLPLNAGGQDYYAEAETLYYGGKYADAVRVSLEGLALQPDEAQAVEFYSILGASYARLGAFDKAAGYMVRCYEYDKSHGEAAGLTSSLISLAGVYVYAGKAELAADYALEAIANEEKIGRPAKLAMACGKACDVYHALQQDSIALEYANRAVSIAHKELGARDEAIRRSQRAYALEGLGRYGQAFADLRFAEQEFRENGPEQSLSIVCFQLAQEYGRRGNKSLERQYLKEAARLTRAQEDLPLLQKVLSRLAESLREDSPAEAYGYLEEASALQDSLVRSKSRSELELYHVEYETDRREEVIRAQNEDLRRSRSTRSVLLAAVLLLVTGAVVTAYFALRARRGAKALESSNAQKDYLLKVISHDIHSPAVARLKGLQMLRKHFGKMSPQEQLELFQNMEHQATAEVELMDNVLRWARYQNGKKPEELVRFNLGELASEVISQYRQVAELKGIGLVLDVDGEQIIRSGRSSLMLVLRNLLSNAIKFSHRSGEVRISISSDASTARICVIDQGIGIPADALESIFLVEGAFRRPGTEGELSNGLGLALSRTLIQALGGSLRAESEEGKGSRFTIELPVNND
ncbi:MAG: HAMP domain-containing histidine kinase [Bacteroidales bacterium]|nr:HAMP domain-containing histidine kinase [Bacteroidales bacterium]